MTTNRPTKLALDADEAEALQEIGWRRSATSSSCPDSSLLLAADEGVVDDATLERVRGHVMTCATCQQLVKDLAEVLGEEPGGLESSRIRARVAAGPAVRRTHRYVWWGGGLAAAAGLVWFLMVPKAPSATVSDFQAATAPPPPITSVFVVDRPAIPPADVDLTVRGESSTPVSLEDQIARALDKADTGDTPGALADLNAIAKAHATSRIAALALGAVQLRGDQSTDAAATLERARALKGDAATADEAGWFLGMALVLAGHVDRARPILEEVCKNRGPRAASACAGVTEIDRNKSGR